uniref:ENTH domain-containing protein n=1 Tax=Ditylenchus dipsaci TaxID=166011 RepID=A0A915E0Y0_9BILA
MSDFFSGISNLTKQVQSTLNSEQMRKIGDKVQGYVMNFTESEAKVREATNEDLGLGPTGPQMQELAHMTFQYDTRLQVANTAQYLLKNGSERVISTARDHLFEMRALESYKCFDERGKDEGINIRHRVKAIIELLQDDELLRSERKKAKQKEEIYLASRAGMKRSQRVISLQLDLMMSLYGSPELGIRERTPEITEDDDEFGDFTEARGASHTKANSTHHPADPAPFQSASQSLGPHPRLRWLLFTGQGSANPMDLFSLNSPISNGAAASQLVQFDSVSPAENSTSLFDNSSTLSSTNTTGMGIKPPSLENIFGSTVGASPANTAQTQDLFGSLNKTGAPACSSIDEIFGIGSGTTPVQNTNSLVDIFSSPATLNTSSSTSAIGNSQFGGANCQRLGRSEGKGEHRL